MVPNQVFTRVTNNRRPTWNGRSGPAGVEAPAPSPSHNRGGFDSRCGRCARNPVPFFICSESAADCLEPVPGDRRATTCHDIRRLARGPLFSDGSRGCEPRRRTREGAAARAEWARAAHSPSRPHTAARARGLSFAWRLRIPGPHRRGASVRSRHRVLAAGRASL